MTTIAEAFTHARLGLKFIQPGTKNRLGKFGNIFQLTIRKNKGGTPAEFFLINMGDGSVRVEALDADPDHRQVLLMVEEEARTIMNDHWSRSERRWVKEAHEIPGARRKVLAGMDQTHLFMAVVPRAGVVNTVVDAHRVLKPGEVMHDQARTNRIKRQGEWFFIPASAREMLLIDEAQRFGLIKPKQPLSGNGKPHVAEYFVRIHGIEYASARVRHSDHHTLKLNGWFRVVRNTEDRQSLIASGGVRWID